MTKSYDIEVARASAERTAEAARQAATHPDLPDWLCHRLSHLAAEAQSFVAALKEHAPCE